MCTLVNIYIYIYIYIYIMIYNNIQYNLSEQNKCDLKKNT